MKLELRRSFLLTGVMAVFTVWLFESQYFLANAAFSLVKFLGVCQFGSSSSNLLTCAKYGGAIYVTLLLMTVMAINLVAQMLVIRKLMWGEILAALVMLIIVPAVTVALMYAYFMQIGLTPLALILGSEIPFVRPALLVNVVVFGLAAIRFQSESGPTVSATSSAKSTPRLTKLAIRKTKARRTR
jgi:Na+-translocating ferredoxin:NAD+ oxidoreductase RnfA subunit